MTNKLLELDLRLLLLRYGRRAVIQALAKLGEQTPEDVERELAAAQERKAKRKPTLKSPSEFLAEAGRDRPELAEVLATIATRLENRSFLPELKDARRFLDRAGIAHGRLRSRREAMKHVVSALLQLPEDELRRIATPPSTEGDSDYAVLAREIMGRKKDEPHQ